MLDKAIAPWLDTQVPERAPDDVKHQDLAGRPVSSSKLGDQCDEIKDSLQRWSKPLLTPVDELSKVVKE